MENTIFNASQTKPRAATAQAVRARANRDATHVNQTLRARGTAGRDERRASRGRGAARELLFCRAFVPSRGRRGARIDARGRRDDDARGAR